MNTQTRPRLTLYFAKSLNLLVIVAMLVTMLPAPASYARPPRQEPEPVSGVTSTPTPTPTLMPNSNPPVDKSIIYLPLILKAGAGGPGETWITPEMGGTFTSPGGEVTLTFAPGAVTQTVAIAYTPLADPQGLPIGHQLVGEAFKLAARTAANQPVTHFLPQVTIHTVPGPNHSWQTDYVVTNTVLLTQTYAQAAITGLDERRLSLHAYDEQRGYWIPLLTVVDPAADTASVPLDYFTDFALIGTTAESSSTLVILDPDHGGDDPGGTVTSPPDYTAEEKNLNLATAQQVQTLLQDCGIQVQLTRVTDQNLASSQRANFINSRVPSATVTIAYNILNHYMSSFNGGPMGLVDPAKPGDVAFSQQLVNMVGTYTGLSTHRGVRDSTTWRGGLDLPSLVPDILYTHIELGFMDAWQDRMIYQDRPEWYAHAVYSATLQTLGITSCTPIAPPPQEQLDYYRRTYGYRPWMVYGGDPVNMVTGQAIQQRQDVHIPAPGFDLMLERTYNSFDTRSGFFGPGWSSNLDTQLRERESDGIVVVRYADGYTPIFYPAEAGTYRAEEGVFETLSKTAAGFTLTRTDGISYEFDSTGKLQRMTDRNGNSLTFTYTGEHLTKMTDTVGRNISFIYEGDSIKQLSDPLGRTWVYTYTDGYLTEVQNANGGVTHYEYQDGRLTHFRDPENIPYLENIYNAQGQVIEQIDASQQHSFFTYTTVLSGSQPFSATIYTDNDGNQTTYLYDELFRVVEVRDALGQTTRYGYDPNYNRETVTDPKGNTTRYKYDERGNLIERTDPVASCAAGYDHDVTTWEYNAQNDVIETTNALDYVTTYEYDSQGNLKAIHEPGERDPTFTYNAWGLLTSMTDANDHTTHYEYDAYGNLIKTTDAEGNITTSTYDLAGRELTYTDPNSHTVTFEYDNNNNITRITDPKDRDTTFTYNLNDLLIQSKDRRGVVSDYQYDENLKLVAERDFPNGQWRRYDYDALYRRVTMTDRRGYVTHYEYDQVSRLTATIDPLGAATRYEYDENDNLTAVIKPLRQRTEMVYDAMNRLRFLIDAAGYKTEYCYDAEDRLIRVTGPRGEVTRYEYDAVNNLVTEIDPLGAVTRYEYDQVDNLKAMIDAANHRTDYVYDKVDRLTTISQPPVRVPGASTPQHPTTGFAYDGVGNTLAITSPRGFVTTFTYDENDNLQTVTDPLGGQVSYAYDEEDNPISVTDPKGYPTTYSYNEAGRPVQIRDPLGHTTRLVYDAGYYLERMLNALNRPTIYEYDPAGRLIRETDPLGNATLYQRDLQGQVTAKTDANGHTTRYGYDVMDRLSMVTDALNQATRYEYDLAGNLVTIIDANNHLTRFTYDLRNQLTKEVNPLDRTWEYGYDAVGSLVRRVDGNRQVTHYSYDSLRRLIGIDYPDATNIRFAYDLDGNEVEMCDWLITEGDCTHTEYDALGRPTRSSDWLGRTIQRAYDAAGNLTRLVYPNNQPVIYDYDARNQVTGLLDHFGQHTTYAYNPVGQLTRINRPNGTATSYAYDEANRLLNLTHQKEHSTFSAFTYALDKVGNRTQIAELRTFPGDGAPVPVTTVKSYSYDALDRLITADTDQGQAVDYTFDPVGNRLQQAGIPQEIDPTDSVEPIRPAPPIENAYDYNEANQLTAVSSQQSAVRLEYDDNGNRVREIETLANGSTHLTEYRYDYENRLTGVIKTEHRSTQIKVTMVATYTYDGYGRRVKKEVRDATRNTQHATQISYVYDGLDPIADYETVGSVTTATHYYWANGGIAEIERLPNPTTGFGGDVHWTHTDGLGSLTDLTDAAGERAVQVYYDEYGQLLTRAVSLGRYSYTGQEFDPETGLYHFYARYYDAERGVWLTQDKWRGIVQKPETLHRYQYTLNNPATYIDKYGYWTGGDDAIAIVGGFAKGTGVKIGSDLVGNLWNHGLDFGGYEWKQWEEYIAAGVAGAVGTELQLYLVPTLGLAGAMIGGAIEGALEPFIRDLLINRSHLDQWCWQNTFRDAIIEATTGSITAGIDILPDSPSIKGRIAEGLRYFVSKRAIKQYEDLTKDIVEGIFWDKLKDGILRVADDLSGGVFTKDLCIKDNSSTSTCNNCQPNDPQSSDTTSSNTQKTVLSNLKTSGPSNRKSSEQKIITPSQLQPSQSDIFSFPSYNSLISGTFA